MPQSRVGMDAFVIAGYEVPGSASATLGSSQTEAKPYAIPPVLWMVMFLVVGYIGLRLLLAEGLD